MFTLGYILKVKHRRICHLPSTTLALCESISYKLTILVAIPAFVVGGDFAVYRAGLAYGEGNGIPLTYQAILYTHMFVGFMFLGLVGDFPKNKRRIWIASVLLMTPRLLISLHWGRFFFAQAVVPIVFIALARGWLRLKVKTLIQLTLLAVAIIFVPAITRGEKIVGQSDSGQSAIITFFQQGSTLRFFEDNKNLQYPCPPLAVALFAKTFPFSYLNVCTIKLGDTKVLATVNNLLTRLYSDDFMRGTGGIYILDLYLTGGVPAIMLGSLFFGFLCRLCVEAIGYRSLFAGIWAECISRALFAPRDTPGYVFERVPTLVLATLCMVVMAHVVQLATFPVRRSRSC